MTFAIGVVVGMALIIAVVAYRISTTSNIFTINNTVTGKPTMTLIVRHKTLPSNIKLIHNHEHYIIPKDPSWGHGVLYPIKEES